MASKSVSVRELRNDTPKVIRLIESGVEVTLTSNGVPIAEIRPIASPRRSRGAAFLERVAEMRGDSYDSGLTDDLAASKAAALAAQADRWG